VCSSGCFGRKGINVFVVDVGRVVWGAGRGAIVLSI